MKKRFLLYPNHNTGYHFKTHKEHHREVYHSLWWSIGKVMVGAPNSTQYTLLNVKTSTQERRESRVLESFKTVTEKLN